MDLLNPTPESEKRKHKLKRLVQSPNSYFMDVKCPGKTCVACAHRGLLMSLPAPPSSSSSPSPSADCRMLQDHDSVQSRADSGPVCELQLRLVSADRRAREINRGSVGGPCASGGDTPTGVQLSSFVCSVSIIVGLFFL